MAGQNLTARFVETVTTKKEREDFRDRSVRGLQLRVTKGGQKKTWTFRYRRKSDRAQRRVSLGSFIAKGEGMSLEDARVKARALQAAVDAGADPAGDVQARKDAETFAEIAADWIERHGKPNKSPGAVRDDRSMLDRHVLPEIGAMKATEITKRDLILLLDKVAAKTDARIKSSKGKEGHSAAAQVNAKAEPRGLTHRPNRVFELVRAIFRWAVGRDLLKIDPTWGMSAPIKKEKPRERELSPDEIRTLWLALDRAPVKRRAWRRVDGEAKSADGIPLIRATALALKLSLATAQRIGEVTGIAIAELDLNDTAPVWTIPGERTKNGRPNRVPLSPLAVALIREAAALGVAAARAKAEAGAINMDSPKWLFPSPNGHAPVDSHAPTKALERARPAIDLDDFRVHDLRRTAATRMAEMGISPHTISLILNHVSARSGTITAKVYVQYSYDREKREALGAWGARLERIIAGADGANVVVIVR